MSGERRRHPRRVPLPDEPIGRLRMRGGAELVAIDVADGGVRAQTVVWPRPGARVEVHLLTRTGRVLQRGRIVRASVIVVQPASIVYELALAFDGVVDTAARVAPTRTGAFQEAVDPSTPVSGPRSVQSHASIGGLGPHRLAPSLEQAEA